MSAGRLRVAPGIRTLRHPAFTPWPPPWCIKEKPAVKQDAAMDTATFPGLRRSGLHRATVAGLLVAATGLLSACATAPPPRVVTEAAADMPECRSIAWAASDERPLGLVDQQIRDQVVAALQRRGYRTVDGEAECTIHHRFNTVGTYARSGPSVGLGVGGGSARVGGGVGLSFPLGGGQRTNAILALDVVDARRNVQVWGGTAELSMAAQQPRPEELSDAVERLLQAFPGRR
jgi:hypothetical protein